MSLSRLRLHGPVARSVSVSPVAWFSTGALPPLGLVVGLTLRGA
jgi:hypothetical protein